MNTQPMIAAPLDASAPETSVPLKRNRLPKPDLIGAEQAKGLSQDRITDLFSAHLNPGQLHYRLYQR